MYKAEAKQDQFVDNMLKNKKNGYYIDIGSCGAVESNNTYYFDSLGWNGICVEINSVYSREYNIRKCKLINDDALKINYKKLFYENNVPKDIDYLSIDIDELSCDVLNIMPFDEYKFKIITIEHDFYLYGDKYKNKQIDILKKNNYILICENVYVQQSGFDKPECAFEDWWVHSDFFTHDLINKIKSTNEYPSNIIKKFNDNIK